MWYSNGTGWWMFFGMIWMVVFWGGLIALIIWAVNRWGQRSTGPEKRSALEFARERYARGEITREQFEQLKKDL
ncbi:MAG: hypothetical protein A2Z29_08280 [Chloroflexi bacterium RBG_16_56_11]|nr:MAG: hypothetical protein A2Z29_08280 [Chloroflexi bacterium RBG_16_56_11]